MSKEDRYWIRARERDSARDWAAIRLANVSTLRETSDFERGYKAALDDLAYYLLRREQRDREQAHA